MFVSIAVIHVTAAETGRAGWQGIPPHPLNHTLTDAPTLPNRERLRLLRALYSFDRKPDQCALRQFDRRFRSKAAMLENRVQQFHCFTNYQYRVAKPWEQTQSQARNRGSLM
jgi:hypothetical protein